MGDVFLVKLEPEYESYSMAPPFGILYLGSALEREGHKVRLYHERGTPKNIQFIVGEVLRDHPLFVGISTFTGPSLLPSIAVSKKIKKGLNIPVVWGGLHPTMLPDQTLKNDYIDLIVTGEGEETIVEIAKVLSEKGVDPHHFKGVRGIGYKRNGGVRINPPRPFIKNLDDYSPAWHLLNIEKYLHKGKYFYSSIGSRMSMYKIAGMISSRGCPWRCGYCYNQFVNRGHFRAHSARKVINDIESLKRNYGVSAVVFEDDGFFTDKDRSLEIIRNIHLPWSSSIRANNLSRWGEAFVKELKTHHCVELRIGAESGSQRILDIMQKDITIKDIHRSVELCLKYNINLLLGFMYGIPGETWADMLTTFQLIDELERKGVAVASGPALFFPYPGTPLYEVSIKKGFVPPQRVEDWAVQWGPKQPLLPFVDRRVKFIGYYRTIAVRRDLSSIRFAFLAKFLKFLAMKRWEKRFFLLPVDYYVPHYVLKMMKALKLRKIVKAIYE